MTGEWIGKKNETGGGNLRKVEASVQVPGCIKRTLEGDPHKTRISDDRDWEARKDWPGDDLEKKEREKFSSKNLTLKKDGKKKVQGKGFNRGETRGEEDRPSFE